MRLLSSRYTLYSIVGLFVLQAAWLTLTTRYPMAFDENFHLGLIQIYAHHWLPFLDSHPPDGGVYGAVARDPSYLYHFLMSFPYRLIAHFTDNLPAQVIILRFISIALAAASLLVYNDVLKRTPISTAVRHMILLIYTVIPVMPLLAAQINYDSLLLLVVALVVRQSLLLLAALRRGQPDARLLLQIVILLMVGSLVKYPFVPIAAAIVAFLLIELVRCAQRMDSFGDSLLGYFRALSWGLRVCYVVGLLVVGALFAQRYVVNLVRYHDPVPDCAQVLPVEECREYAPWGRDYQYAIWNQDRPRDNPLVYGSHWVKQLMREFFFGVYSRFLKDSNVVWYLDLPPVGTLMGLGWFTLAAGTIGVIVYWRTIWRRPVLRLFLLIAVVYVAALFYQNYKMYLHTGVEVAIHGRYVLPIVPLIFVLYIYSWRRALAALFGRVVVFRSHWPALQAGLVLLILVLCTQGGGFTTYLLRNRAEFSWPQSQLARNLNGTAQRVLDKIIIE